MDRYAQMFITPEEFDRLLDEAVTDLGLRVHTDRRSSLGYIYVTQAPTTDDGVRLQRPRAQGRVLYLAQHDLRTTDEALVRLFDRLRRRWNKFLARPVRARNVVHGGGWRSYRRIAFTGGALAMHDAGWKWKQDGVHNVEFAPEPKASRPRPIP